MSDLYMPERHEQLCDMAWSADRAAEAIARIAADFASAVRPDGSWPNHPLDLPDDAALRETFDEPRWSAYFGAAGAIATLRILAAEGYPVEDLSGLLPRVHAAYLKHPDLRQRQVGLQMGEIGILAPAVLANPSDARLAARLDACMTEIVGHPAREITSGETGMLHAALTLYRANGDPRWADHFRIGAESLWKAWTQRSESGHWLWTSDIFGSVRGYYGACHGVAGNVGALLRGADLLPDKWVEAAIERASSTLRDAALTDGERLNWSVSGDASGQRRLVHWCHGAPGVVIAIASVDWNEPALESTLLRAGEFVWNAGPLAKGPGLCHGTGGNGYAFLALYARTGDERWLDRGRRFAMHAIGQSERARKTYGQRRYTLWTGDGGLAVYLHDCIHPARVAFPGLERF